MSKGPRGLFITTWIAVFSFLYLNGRACNSPEPDNRISIDVRQVPLHCHSSPVSICSREPKCLQSDIE